MHVIGVGAVLTNAAGQVLLVRTARAGWELPGGRVESGEDLHAALRREVREEAGCDVTIGVLVGVYAHVRHDTLILIFCGSSSTAEPAPTGDDDALEAAWFTPDEALRSVTHVTEHEKLADALAAHPGVVYRADPSKPPASSTFSRASTRASTSASPIGVEMHPMPRGARKNPSFINASIAARLASLAPPREVR